MWEYARSDGIGFTLFVLIAALLIRRLIYSTGRVLMVRKQGWPPAHLDADGEFQSTDAPDETDEA